MGATRTIRGLASCNQTGNLRHFFGSYATPSASPTNKLPYVVKSSLRWYCCSEEDQDCADENIGGCGRTWLIGSDVTEVLRGSEVQMEPLSGGQVDGSESLPEAPAQPAVRNQNRSLLKLQVILNRWGGEHVFFMDTNQWLEVESTDVTFRLYAPSNFEEIGTGRARPNPLPTRTGLVGDALIGTAAIEIEAPTSPNKNSVIFTENLFVADNTRQVIRVPPFARSVTIYQNPLGVPAVVWVGRYSDPNITDSIEAQSLPFIVGLRKTEPLEILPDVTHLETDLAVGDRFFTLQWDIVP